MQSMHIFSALKRDLERKYYSDQLDNNKADKKIMEYNEICDFS